MLINVFVCQIFPWCRWTLSINFLFCEIELLGARSPCPDTDSGTTWTVLCSRCCIQDTECSKVQTLVTLGIGPDGPDGALALMIYFNPWSTLTEVYWRMKAIDTEKLRRNTFEFPLNDCWCFRDVLMITWLILCFITFLSQLDWLKYWLIYLSFRWQY